MIKAILFDLDLTLLDRDAMFRNYAYELVRKYAPSADLIESWAEQLILKDEHGYGNTKEMYQPMIDAWNLDMTVQDMILEWGRFMDHGVIAYPHVREVLEQLKKTYKLGLVTNGYSDVQRLKVKGAGLEAYWDVIVVSGDIQVEKPDPSIFRKALEELKVLPEDAVMVGDHLEKDIDGALGAGIKAIWFDHGEKMYEYNGPRIQSIEQLPEVLQQYE